MTRTLRPSTSIRALWLALLALAAACSGPATSHDGPPPKLTGQLVAAATGAADGPVRLALAWYPGLMTEDGRSISQPGAIEAQDVAYVGTLPQTYTFDVVDAPPATALRPMPAGFRGQGAIGILLAYEDGDADGVLDTIPGDGAPVDHVLGASLEWTTSPAFVLVYLTDDQPAATGLRAGFNLLKITDAVTTEVVAPTTPIPVSVSQGGAMLDLFVCEAAWDGSGSQAPCGLVLDDQPVEEVLHATVEGELYVGPDLAEAAFGLVEDVSGEPTPIADATVRLDGVVIPYDAGSGLYRTSALDPSAFAEERAAALVVTRGGAALRRTVAIPAFDFTSVPASVETSTAFDVAWSVPASAASFDLTILKGPVSYLYAAGLTGSPYHVTPLELVGEARLTVAARAPGEISVTVVRTTTLTFEPRDAPVEEPLQIGGVVDIWDGGAETRLFVQDAGVRVNDATVTLGDGTPVPYDAETGWYTLGEYDGSSLFAWGSAVPLRVEHGGRVLTRTLLAPGLPAITSPEEGAWLASGTPVTVAWDPAANAQHYDVLLELTSAPTVISGGRTAGRTVTLATAGEGYATVYVSAVRRVEGGADAVIELSATRATNVVIVR